MLVRDVRRAEIQSAARMGFTLMELLVVVAIIVILAGAAIPIYSNMVEGARKDRAAVDVIAIGDAVLAYRTKHGEWPASLAILTQQQPNGDKPLFEPEKLIDPWKRDYQYNAEGPHNSTYGKPDIWSTGPNGNEQIGNWAAGR